MQSAALRTASKGPQLALGLSSPSSPRGSERLTPAPPPTHTHWTHHDLPHLWLWVVPSLKALSVSLGSQALTLLPFPSYHLFMPSIPEAHQVGTSGHRATSGFSSCVKRPFHLQVTFQAQAHGPQDSWPLESPPPLHNAPRLPSTNSPTQSPAPLLILYETV